MKNNRSSEGGSQKVEHSRAKRKSSTETVAPVDCVFCREKEKGYVKNVNKNRNSLRNYKQQEGTTQVFRAFNEQHVEFLTEQWREMASLLGNIEILSYFRSFILT